MSGMIPDVVSEAARPYVTAGVKEPLQVPRTEAERPVRSRTPVVDEYVPEEKREPSGLYWPGRDEGGRPKVFFDGPERADSGPSDIPAPAEEAGEAELCTADTGRVDGEIRRLKQQKERLEQQIGSRTGEAEIKELERKLARTERELAQKDNDAYRRQHAVFT